MNAALGSYCIYSKDDWFGDAHWRHWLAQYETELQRGKSLYPIKNSSAARAAWRPSRIAQTTND